MPKFTVRVVQDDTYEITTPGFVNHKWITVAVFIRLDKANAHSLCSTLNETVKTGLTAELEL